MKQRMMCFLAAFLAVFYLSPKAFAASDPKEFYFSLSVDGADTVEVDMGDVITVVFRLKRTDQDSKYMMYAMQNEIRYDSTFFELVEGSVILAPDIVSTDIALVDQNRELYMNYLSMSGGNLWDPDTFIGSFQLRVIAESGVTKITNQEYLVADVKNEGPHTFTCQDVTVIRSSSCTITFETNGGSSVESQTVYFGEQISKPTDLTREGYTLEGWYSDIYLQNRWDFEKDMAQGNITLYAKWVKVEPAITPGPGSPSEKPTDTPSGDPSGTPSDDPAGTPSEEPSAGDWWIVIPGGMAVLLLLFILCCGKKRVKFDARGGSPVETQKLRKGEHVSRPVDPVKPNAQFDGWYSDQNLTNKWDFDHDTVTKSITLYARWK